MIGGPTFVKKRVAAYWEAGVTTLNVTPIAEIAAEESSSSRCCAICFSSSRRTSKKSIMAINRISANRLGAASVAFVGYTTAMLLLERRMRATGGPGIIKFELAGSAAQAEDIMTRWGSDGQRAARLSLWLDFGYMATYGTLTALLVDRARRRRGHPAVLPAIIIVAVAADASEGVSLLKVLNRRRIATHARRAQIAAFIKFAVLAAALGYVATDQFAFVRGSGHQGGVDHAPA